MVKVVVLMLIVVMIVIVVKDDDGVNAYGVEYLMAGNRDGDLDATLK